MIRSRSTLAFIPPRYPFTHLGGEEQSLQSVLPKDTTNKLWPSPGSNRGLSDLNAEALPIELAGQMQDLHYIFYKSFPHGNLLLIQTVYAILD